MRKADLRWLLAISLLFVDVASAAQQAARLPKIGWLSGTVAGSPTAEAFFQGMRDLGYVEGKNILIERRFAAGDRAHQRAYAAELARLNVDIIVASSGGDTRAAKEATTTIPIVMAQADDPVASGFVASLAHPGGNITGLSTLSPELSGKRLELAKEVLPKLSRVAVFGTTSSPGNAPVLKEIQLAAAALGLNIQFIDILAPNQIDAAFQSAAKSRAEAFHWSVSGSVDAGQRPRITELANKHRLPGFFDRRQYVEEGGLMSYGVDLRDMARRAATYVDKILKGTKPEDLPVEQPKKFEFIVNLKAAKAIGLTIPPNVLVRADRVIR